MAGCTERWIDVFVTKPDLGVDKQEYAFDDQFVCSVQSVRIDPDLSTVRAVIVQTSTDWIMPTWTKEYENTSTFTHEVFNSIEVGDLIRIGSTPTVGHTDYLTVVEKLEVDQLFNATNQNVPITRDASVDISSVFSKIESPDTGQNYIATSDTSGGSKSYTFTAPRKQGIAHYALRLNMAVNCTSMPTNVPVDSAVLTKTGSDGALQAGAKASIQKRNLASTPLTSPKRADEVNFFPMYTTKPCCESSHQAGW